MTITNGRKNETADGLPSWDWGVVDDRLNNIRGTSCALNILRERFSKQAWESEEIIALGHLCNQVHSAMLGAREAFYEGDGIRRHMDQTKLDCELVELRTYAEAIAAIFENQFQGGEHSDKTLGCVVYTLAADLIRWHGEIYRTITGEDWL